MENSNLNKEDLEYQIIVCETRIDHYKKLIDYFEQEKFEMEVTKENERNPQKYNFICETCTYYGEIADKERKNKDVLQFRYYKGIGQSSEESQPEK